MTPMTTVAVVTTAFTAAAAIRLAHGEYVRNFRRSKRHDPQPRILGWFTEGSRH